MFKTTAWQAWALGWRFVFFCYFFATTAFILGLGASWVWFAVFMPPAIFYHVLGSCLWNGKQWTRKAAISEHAIVGIAEAAFVVFLFLKAPQTPGWKDFSFLAAKVAAVDIILRLAALSYLIKNKDFPKNCVKSDKQST